MYTLKIETDEGTYLCEAQAVHYKKMNGFSTKEKEDLKIKEWTVFGSNSDDFYINADGKILRIEYCCSKGIKQVFYVIKGKLFILQNGNTIDMVIMK